MQIHNAAVTGSFTYNGIDISDITGSEQSVVSLNEFSASILNYTSSNNQSVATLQGATASLQGATSSLFAYTASNSANVATLFATSASLNAAVTQIYNATASLYAATASIYGATSSLFNYSASSNLRIGSLEQYTASLNTRSASFACVDATNNFACTQYFSNTSNAVSFTSTGSLYSDGGVRITKDMYVSGTAFFNNVTVFGTQSINYISSSQLNIASNIISVNTATPTIRFGGLAVYDSGSLGTGLTGSILWDSEDNQWIYSNPSGSTYDSALFLVGPRNTGVLGNEQGISCNFLSKGNGLHHMTSSAIFDDGTRTCFYGSSIITNAGVGCFSGAVCAPAFVGGTVSGTTSTFVSGVISGTPANTSSLLLENFNGDQTATTLRLKSGRADVFYHMQAFSSNTSEVFRIESSGRVVSAAGACFASTICAGTGVFGNTGAGSFSLSITNNDQSNTRIRLNNTGTGGGVFSLVAGNPGASNAGLAVFDENCSATRIYFNSAGNVGIGTTSPNTKLDVRICDATAYATTCSGNALTLYNVSTTTNAFVGIDFLGEPTAGNAGRAAINMITVGSGAGDLTFGTRGSSVFGERMRITSTGNVGIGCNTPANSRLLVAGTHVSGNSILGVVPVSNNVATIGLYNSSGVRTALFYSDTGFVTVETDTDPLLLRTAGTNRLSISSTGIACFACQVCAPAFVGGTVSGTTATFTNTGRFVGTFFSDCRLMVGTNFGDQYYASVFIGGALTCGTSQYALLLDPQLSGTSNYGLLANARIKASTAVTNAYGVYIMNNELLSGASITNNYGLYIGNQTNGSSVNYALYSVGGASYFGGCIGIGTSTPCGRLHLTGIYNGAQNTLNLENNWPNTFETSLINFWAYYNNTNPQAVIEAGQDSSATNAGTIMLKTMLSGATPVTRMKIFPSGLTCFQNTVCAPTMVVNFGPLRVGPVAAQSTLYVNSGNDGNRAAFIHSTGTQRFSMYGKYIQSYAGAAVNVPLFVACGMANTGIMVKVNIYGSNAVSAMRYEDAGYAGIFYIGGGFQGANASITTICNLGGVGHSIGTLYWGNTGSNPILYYCQANNGYIAESLDVHVTIRDSANVFFCSEFISCG